MRAEESKSQMFEKEKKTLRSLFIFFTLSFLVESMIQIPYSISIEHFWGQKPSVVFVTYLMQTIFPVYFDCTSILVILVLHRKSFSNANGSERIPISNRDN